MLYRTYGELSLIEDYEERFDYLRIGGEVGGRTFGADRHLNQSFYRSREWKDLRQYIIARDNGCDMGHSDFPILGQIIVHHINPLSAEEVTRGGESLFDPNNLVCVSHATHNAIHYGDKEMLPKPYLERQSGDTKLW